MAGATSIGKAGGEDVVGMGTQAWNIADGFTKIKILRILIQLDLFETIAMFGRNDIEEQVPQDEIPYRRVEGFDRIIFALRQLIGNCQFAIEHGRDEEKINSYLERIECVERVAGGISDNVTNEVTKENTLRINEEHFRKCFDILRAIKDELNFPVNHAGLIFRQGEELDLDKIMRDIEEG